MGSITFNTDSVTPGRLGQEVGTIGGLNGSTDKFTPSVPTISTSDSTTGQTATPSTTQTGTAKASNTTGGSYKSAPPPRSHKMWYIKSKVLSPALTSNFACWFYPLESVANWIKERNLSYVPSMQQLMSINCSEASLPGSSLITNEINDDFHGVTERHAYRRQYDDRADFTFYINDDYDSLWFFEQWIAYIADEQYNSTDRPSVYDSKSYFYRIRYPIDYKSTIYIQKFERDFAGRYLEYSFLQAYPISINSIPVSYDSSQLLKCTVSFSYARYVVNRKTHGMSDEESSGGPKTAPGVPDPNNPASNDASMDENMAIWALSNQSMINNRDRAPVNINSQDQILSRANSQYPAGSPERARLLQKAQSYNPNVRF